MADPSGTLQLTPIAERVSETLVFDRKALTEATDTVLPDNGIRYESGDDLRGLLLEE